MNVSFNKAVMATAATLVALVLANSAEAVTLGYPRGRPYYGAPHNTQVSRYLNYAPAQTNSDTTRQSFSYEPSERRQGTARPAQACRCDNFHAGRFRDRR